jgi:ABC-type phosphate transport system substrate-binding protein
MHRKHTLRTLALTAAAAVAAVLTASPALADPPGGVTPRVIDVVGVGSGATQLLYDQLSHDYGFRFYPALYSWDAMPSGGMITPKAGCTPIVRPADSSSGISALVASQTLSTGTEWCIDYARSARPPAPSPLPPCNNSTGLCFVPLGGETVTWASRSAAAGGTNAPATLTTAQLAAIYNCIDTNWSQVGGKNAPIHPFLPQTSSDIGGFFLTALGLTSPGPCVSDSSNTLIENEGVAPELNDPDAIVPYSVADFIAQVYHSAPCTNGAGCGYPGVPACTPAGHENLFGCDLHGVLTIKQIQSIMPTTPGLPAPPTPPAINGKVKANPSFSSLFQRTMFTVVRFDGTTTDHIPVYLRPFFDTAANGGWICGSATAHTDIQAYGFVNLGTACGTS